MQNLKQGARSINDYKDDFYQLIARVNLAEIPNQLVSRLIGGLRFPFQDALNLLSLATVSETHQCVTALERQLTRRAATPFTPSTSKVLLPTISADTGRTSSSRLPAATGSSPAQSRGTIPLPRNQGALCGPCFACGDVGHRISQCPRRYGNRGLLIQDEEYDFIFEIHDNMIFEKENSELLVSALNGQNPIN